MEEVKGAIYNFFTQRIKFEQNIFKGVVGVNGASVEEKFCFILEFS
jgi:hypothetical protein